MKTNGTKGKTLCEVFAEEDRRECEIIQELRLALRTIRDQSGIHVGPCGERIEIIPDCYCPRCVAVRALDFRPKNKR